MAILRLDKFLSSMGCASRSEIKKFAKNGLIKVNGKIEKDVSKKVDTGRDEVIFDNKIIDYREFVYIMLNKPSGVVSATFDNVHKTVVEILSQEYKKFEVFPVGRLDIDTEGLLILTNDGKFAHNLLSPKKNVKKKYFARVSGIVEEDDIVAFKQGIVLDDDYRTLPAELLIISADDENGISECEVTIQEGKFHQIKRMFAGVGKKVEYLKRIQIGELKLDEKLELGEYRELTEIDIEKIGVKSEATV